MIPENKLPGMKINFDQENPIDLWLTRNIVEPMTPQLKEWKWTANDITTMRLIFGLLSLYFIVKKKKYLAMVSYILSYTCDVADGYYARKYKMTSQFGDYYDHIADWIIFAGLIYLLLIKNGIKKKALLIIVLLVACLCIFMGCQEKGITKDTSYILGMCKMLCPNSNFIRYIKYLGSGTLHLYLVILIYMYTE
jgi:phosphatidylglycerophosphate synthase